VGKEHFDNEMVYFILFKTHVDPEYEQDEPMADISEHHTEQEWESNCCEKCRVGLLVPGYTVSLYNLLG